MADTMEETGLGSRIGGALKKGLTGVWNQTRAARLRMEITSLNGQKQDRFAEIGKKVYTLYERGAVRNTELLALCGRVRDIDLDLMEREQELSQIGVDERSSAMPPAPYEGGIEEELSDRE